MRKVSSYYRGLVQSYKGFPWKRKPNFSAMRSVLLKANKQFRILMKTNSEFSRGKFYFQTLELVDIEKVINTGKKRKWSKVRILQEALFGGRLRVYCDCPAFKFFGFFYMSMQFNYDLPYMRSIIVNTDQSYVAQDLRSANRRPDIRNPHLQGGVCKHVKKALESLPLYISVLVKYFSDKM